MQGQMGFVADPSVFAAFALLPKFCVFHLFCSSRLLLSEVTLRSDWAWAKKAKDAMNQTGGGAVKFDYFDQMDDVLRNDPSVRPPVLISSLGGDVTAGSDDDNDSGWSSDTTQPMDAVPPPKGKLEKKSHKVVAKRPKRKRNRSNVYEGFSEMQKTLVERLDKMDASRKKEREEEAKKSR
eukprot:TRINITY_DN355_c1_g3_i2.p1 TRINITY_DN355_c1_g3~~TRINITY_DN355_c1_g3_i2.p1  ORF type:complete len:180 (+),score=32.79 TRINITY_DN355_c1_g3_i2:301-840(+)